MQKSSGLTVLSWVQLTRSGLDHMCQSYMSNMWLPAGASWEA